MTIISYAGSGEWACILLRTPADLHEEGVRQEGIIVHLDSSDIANHLEDFAAEYGAQERPCAVSDSEEQLDDENEGEHGEIESIAGEGGVVLDLGPREGAGLDGAEPGFVVER